MVTMRADVIVLLEIKSVNEFVALVALSPEIVRDSLGAFAASQWWFFENAHSFVCGKPSCRSGLGQWLNVAICHARTIVKTAIFRGFASLSARAHS